MSRFSRTLAQVAAVDRAPAPDAPADPILGVIGGDPGQARHILQHSRAARPAAGQAYSNGWVDFIIGMSYLWESQVLLCEEYCARRWRTESGTRAPAPGGVHAGDAGDSPAAGDKIDEATAMLANRLDVLERSDRPGRPPRLPDNRAHRPLSRASSIARPRPCRSPECRRGRPSCQPRLCIASLAEQIRIPAIKSRTETCRVLVAQVDAIAARGPVRRSRCGTASGCRRRSPGQRGDCAGGKSARRSRHGPPSRTR